MFDLERMKILLIIFFVRKLYTNKLERFPAKVNIFEYSAFKQILDTAEKVC